MYGMTKLEFGDINRFVASLGIMQIVISLLLPWLLERSFAEFIISVSDYEALTESSKLLVDQQQETIGILNNLLPWAMVILLLSGVLMLLIGLAGWNRRQKVSDQSLQATARKELAGAKRAEYEVQALSQGEQVEKAAKEIVEQERLEEDIAYKKQDAPAEQVIGRLRNYMQVEEEVLNEFSIMIEPRHRLLRQVRMHDQNYDAIVSVASNDKKIMILEIKNYQSIPSPDMQNNIEALFLEKLGFASGYASIKTGILVLVYENDTNNSDTEAAMIKRTIGDKKGESIYLVIVVHRKKIQTIRCKELEEFIQDANAS